MKVSLVDAGPLVAWFDPSEAAHAHDERKLAGMDFVAASLYWLASETGITGIPTIDVEDFARYRLPDGRAFQLH